jgi:purine-binding chemotaxis protein CheW
MGETKTLVFGMMRAAGREMAVAADAIQEVVPWPAQITAPLRSSEMIRGLFDLRGQPVPIVALDGLFGGDALSGTCGNVAVLNTPNGRLGLAVDSIGGILRAADGQVGVFAGGAATTLMRGLLRTATQGIVPILDEAALAAMPGMLFLPEAGGAHGDAAARALRTWLVFTCGAFRFCVEATCVREIIDEPRIAHAGPRIDLYRGAAHVRGGVAAVVDLLTLLALPDRGVARAKLLVLEQDGAVLGLAISEIAAIERRRADDMLAVPDFGPVRRDLIAGLLAGAAPEEPDIVVLSHAAILADPKIRAIRGLHADITRGSVQAGTRTAYLKIDAGRSLYIDLSQVAEILAMPERDIQVGPTDETYLGLLRRGAGIWPMIRLRTLLDGQEEADPASMRVLLARGARAGFGFVADAVQAIEYLAVRDDLGSTSARGGMRNAALCPGTSNIWTDSPDGPSMRMVLDLHVLADHLAARGLP